MNKQEAIRQMMRGEKITHTNFSKEEWMTMRNGKIVFEDGYEVSQVLFWRDRQAPGWEDGYSLL